MVDYHWEQIVMLLLDKIENMRVHEEEMSKEIDRLMSENAREKDEMKLKVIELVSNTHDFCREDVLEDLLNKIGEL